MQLLMGGHDCYPWYNPRVHIGDADAETHLQEKLPGANGTAVNTHTPPHTHTRAQAMSLSFRNPARRVMIWTPMQSHLRAYHLYLQGKDLGPPFIFFKKKLVK